ncbi:MAG: hypothetical protein AAF799_45160 [Myxococcota bacterium]
MAPRSLLLACCCLAAATGCDPATGDGGGDTSAPGTGGDTATPATGGEMADGGSEGDAGTEPADPFDNGPGMVLGALTYRGFECYADPSGSAESYQATIAFESDDALLVEDVDGVLHNGSFSVSGEVLTLSVPSLGFEESSLDGDIGLGELLSFETPSLYCNLFALDYRQADDEDGFLCPNINHDTTAGYYEWNRFYFTGSEYGGVWREEFLEFTMIPDTQVQRRAGVYKEVDGSLYLGFGAQGGDEMTLLSGARQGEGFVVDQLDPSAGICAPIE